MVMDCHKENKNKFKRCITPKAQHIWNMDTLRMHKHFEEMLSIKSKFEILMIFLFIPTLYSELYLSNM